MNLWLSNKVCVFNVYRLNGNSSFMIGWNKNINS